MNLYSKLPVPKGARVWGIAVDAIKAGQTIYLDDGFVFPWKPDRPNGAPIGTADHYYAGGDTVEFLVTKHAVNKSSACQHEYQRYVGLTVIEEVCKSCGKEKR